VLLGSGGTLTLRNTSTTPVHVTLDVVGYFVE
jgi:hypothetical protein